MRFAFGLPPERLALFLTTDLGTFAFCPAPADCAFLPTAFVALVPDFRALTSRVGKPRTRRGAGHAWDGIAATLAESLCGARHERNRTSLASGDLLTHTTLPSVKGALA